MWKFLASSWTNTGRIVRRLLRPLLSWETLLFFERDLRNSRVRRVEPLIPLEIRETNREAFRSFESLLLRAGKKWEDLEARFERGDRCFLAFREGCPIHFTWMATSRAWIPEICANMRVAPGEGYLFDAYTDPAMRGRAIQPAVASFVLQHEQDHGFSRHLLYINRANVSGLQVLGKAADTMPTLKRTVRCFRFLRIEGRLLMGLEGEGSPSFEFPEGVRIRRFGKGILWVSGTVAAPRRP